MTSRNGSTAPGGAFGLDGRDGCPKVREQRVGAVRTAVTVGRLVREWSAPGFVDV